EQAASKKAKLKANSSQLATSVWGISATIGNLDEAREVLLSPLILKERSSDIGTPLHLWRGAGGEVVKAKMDKRIEVLSVLPDEIETYPWAGHLGIKLAEKVV